MFLLKKKFRFEASHQLIHHDGKCARLHGHSWVLVVAVKGFNLYPNFSKLPDPISQLHGKPVPSAKRGMLMDYGDLKSIIQPIVDSRLDHWHLNDKFDTDSPTSEFIAVALYHQIKRALWQWQVEAGISEKGDYKISLAYVEIRETCTSGCRYSE